MCHTLENKKEMNINTQRALLEFDPLSKWRVLPRKGLLNAKHLEIAPTWNNAATLEKRGTPRNVP